MLSEDEIIRAHDTLLSVLNGDVPCEFADAEQKMIINAALDTLCWVLGHTHNPQFQKNLKMIREQLRVAGYVQVRDNVDSLAVSANGD